MELTDPNGNTTAFVYYAQSDTFPGENADFQWGREVLIIPQKFELVKQVIDGRGTADEAITSFAFDYSNHATKTVTSITDPRGTVTQYTMNPRGNVVEARVVLPGGDNVTTMRWAYEDGINDVYMTKKVEPTGRIVTYAYDANGNMTEEKVDLSAMAGYAPVLGPCRLGGHHGRQVVDVRPEVEQAAHRDRRARQHGDVRHRRGQREHPEPLDEHGRRDDDHRAVHAWHGHDACRHVDRWRAAVVV